MKKTLTILLILCVAAALFASGFSVNAGGAFDLFNLKTDKADETEIVDTFSGNGLGFDIGVQYDFSSNIMAYADFNMVFPSDFTYSKTDHDPISFKDIIKWAEESAELLTDGKVSHSLFLLDASIGAAYKFDFKPVELAVGGGAYVNLMKCSIGVTGTFGDDKVDHKEYFSFLTVGVSTLVEAKYLINDNIAVRLAVMPQIGIFSKRDIAVYNNGVEDESKAASLSGVGISFTMPVTIGASYSF